VIVTRSLGVQTPEFKEDMSNEWSKETNLLELDANANPSVDSSAYRERGRPAYHRDHNRWSFFSDNTPDGRIPREGLSRTSFSRPTASIPCSDVGFYGRVRLPTPPSWRQIDVWFLESASVLVIVLSAYSGLIPDFCVHYADSPILILSSLCLE
jgi:hypothetical protein